MRICAPSASQTLEDGVEIYLRPTAVRREKEKSYLELLQRRSYVESILFCLLFRLGGEYNVSEDAFGKHNVEFRKYRIRASTRH